MTGDVLLRAWRQWDDHPRAAFGEVVQLRLEGVSS